ncbi:hypothetical protein MFMK1_003587 [Metallumcola ferriviriculae]|uniref:Uncharacterized protein n=1 Tax=Metallumcola ferriviriculae TaxID=3039180 RepID=A0AAU0USV5_9FIRM|nr:hypothetical protein MFMK1_003587 [Desulfitibacteraceae bacterium MK1]
MKRHLLVALIIVAVSLTLFGCSSSGSKLKVGETSSGNKDSKTPTQQDSKKAVS